MLSIDINKLRRLEVLNIEYNNLEEIVYDSKGSNL